MAFGSCNPCLRLVGSDVGWHLPIFRSLEQGKKPACRMRIEMMEQIIIPNHGKSRRLYKHSGLSLPNSFFTVSRVFSFPSAVHLPPVLATNGTPTSPSLKGALFGTVLRGATPSGSSCGGSGTTQRGGHVGVGLGAPWALAKKTQRPGESFWPSVFIANMMVCGSETTRCICYMVFSTRQVFLPLRRWSKVGVPRGRSGCGGFRWFELQKRGFWELGGWEPFEGTTEP